jgi:hypothetical protein
MSAGAPSRAAIAMTWLALVLAAGLLAMGAYTYGFSLQVHQRFWSDIADRIRGPMTFRFILQPTMALIAAIPDGISNARAGDDGTRGGARQALLSMARTVLLGLSMDVIYQYKVLDRFYPAEAVMMAVLLALIPYFVFRWITQVVAGWWFARREHRTP